MTAESQETTPRRSKIVLRSPQERHGPSLTWTLMPILAIMTFLYQFDPSIENEIAWMIGGMGIGLVIFETTGSIPEQQVSVTVYPLGIQLVSSDGKTIFFPRACLLDCIVLEHVQAFQVTSHVVLRVSSQNQQQQDDLQIIQVFPGAKMSFTQCLALKAELERAMGGFGWETTKPKAN
jgi:hypothetical protein